LAAAEGVEPGEVERDELDDAGDAGEVALTLAVLDGDGIYA